MRSTKIGTALAGLALAIVGTMVTVAPAQAAIAGRECYKLSDGFLCAPLAVNWPFPRDLGLLVEHGEDPVIPRDLAELVDQHLVQGTSKLSEAAQTTDPARSASLRTDALTTFVSAARAAGGSRLFVRRAGWIDPVTGRFEPEPDPWLWESGVDEADGIAWLQRSFADPANAARYRSLAMAQFDEAYTEIATKRVIVG
jgi:hypothetical protein